MALLNFNKMRKMFSTVYNNNLLKNLSADTDKFILKQYYFYMQVWATRHITNYLLEINFRKKKAIKETQKMYPQSIRHHGKTRRDK